VENAPVLIKKGLGREEAEQLKAKLEAGKDMSKILKVNSPFVFAANPKILFLVLCSRCKGAFGINWPVLQMGSTAPRVCLGDGTM
jgi:hypothetical protein